MLKYAGYDIVFQEIPDEVTLAINLTLCPNNCEGCHSPYLREDIGKVLNEKEIDDMVEQYVDEITCICFMGGDGDPQEVARLADYLHDRYDRKFLTAWYSGNEDFPQEFKSSAFDYVKLGGYIPECGPINKETTNQRLYRMLPDGKHEDITLRFWKK